jgi:hypothetical protein
MKMEIPTPAGQLDHPALRLLALRPELFMRQGHIAASWRCREGKRFGPYYRLGYRENGRQHSVYLGRASELVDCVRQRLAALQRPKVERRAVRSLERQVRAALRSEKRHLNALLCPYGLYMKGFEVRGWRFSPLRRYLPRRRNFMQRLFATPSASRVCHPSLDSPAGRSCVAKQAS